MPKQRPPRGLALSPRPPLRDGPSTLLGAGRGGSGGSEAQNRPCVAADRGARREPGTAAGKLLCFVQNALGRPGQGQKGLALHVLGVRGPKVRQPLDARAAQQQDFLARLCRVKLGAWLASPESF